MFEKLGICHSANKLVVIPLSLGKQQLSSSDAPFFYFVDLTGGISTSKELEKCFIGILWVGWTPSL